MTTDSEFTIVGKPVPVKDGVEEVTGNLEFAVDLAVLGMAHGKILRSPHAHARIKRIDASRAESLPGVLGVLLPGDTPGTVWDGCWLNYRGAALDGVARFAGDEVAAVAAETEAIAEVALELIEIDYELLPAVLDAEQALTPGAPQIHEDGNAREPYVVEWGDISEGERQADHVIECEVDFASQQMAPIGRNACVAEWDAGSVTVRTSSQTPSELQSGLAQALDLPQSRIRVISGPTGSSLGQWWSNNFMMITALLARKVGRAVKIELDNAECFATVKRRHKEHATGRIGVTEDGRISFIDVRHVIDNGGYGFKDSVGFFALDNWGRTENGRCFVQGVSTNLVTAGCMRGVGDVTLSSAVERLCDMAAAKLGIDPVKFRLNNQIAPGDALRHIKGKNIPQIAEAMKADLGGWRANIPDDMRERWPEPFHLSSGSTAQILRDGAEAFGWKDKWLGWGKPYSVDGPIRRAVGVGTGIHCCGVELDGNMAAIVRINPDGSAKVFCAVGRQGQGSETTQTQVAAEALGIPFERIEIETGDTDSCPWSHGSIASNTMYRMGFATWSAAIDAKQQLLAVAAREIFDADPDDLDVRDGEVVFKSPTQGKNLRATVEEVLHVNRSDAFGPLSTITGRTCHVLPPSTTFARHFAAHFVDLEVDIETGEIRLLDYIAAQDSGTVVNPPVLANQVIGGAICGAGFAIHEGLAFDDETGAIINDGFLDYKVLRAADFPSRARVLFGDSYDPAGPYGARGAGEAPIAAPIPAISQAVYNATGVWLDIPMTPERVLAALGRI